ncbi:glyoxylate/hydroxypyruvate reductase A, putative [Phytophthora infestans T30-4]|uniref:Glyoxylate/hydroxypyruvate reductase A, putative n=2 Tax=Phytophthora infestans TaxID=4787 RepID=D0NST9_PHYIT|nr:glyoxylate/hydroxypyruvate reductase A, putative [Phytophthora infestans T30-4]EEY64651.1 glyoxylate/hydroxypyruvate reductase A, putative [Phytophthora infestans T30-4]KAF4039246.1 D-isomer specific 2-hydroxyacid dehydrogenase NAD binding domain [Phytophthora infestans]KAF4127236.1 D-isomer specific 2-hydroxyacid dehydrogenase NAD binding domain-containing protein [Phytophthora infestans]KAF4138386.1 D-isomer specific 2-hydroxyacid dehydrogenase NAD binding domain-containing protein [Phytop|eukprot:XP_002897851.1 glyoxylate/hydroxypyruvate reductase A, putative [Phytophthora infestans T30-4]
MTALTTSIDADSISSTSPLRVPIMTFIAGIGVNVRKAFAASDSPAGELYRSGKLELIDIPLPQLVGNKQDPLHGPSMEDPGRPIWNLTPEQQSIVDQAEIVMIDSHGGGPVFMAPKENLPDDKQHILTNVKWIQATYAGVDMYLDLLPKGPHAVVPNFILTRAGGMMPRIMAQYVLGYVTMIERKLLEAKEYQSKRDYARVDMISFRPAQSVTVGILGLGDIGQYTGKMLRSCGYKVLGFKRRVSAQDVADLAECADHITTSLDEVLAKSDYLINLLPSTSATRYVLNEKNLELCRELSPVLINIGRGDVISEKTLIDALNKGTLSKAVLDVFEKEPLPKESELWEHPSVLLTPHVSGKVFPEDVAAMFLDNFNRYIKDEPVRYKVDWAKGY